MRSSSFQWFVDLWCKAEIMHPMTCMFSVQISIGKFRRRPLVTPKYTEGAFYHLLKHKLSYKGKPLKNGSSHTDGASTKMPYVFWNKEAVCCSQTNHLLQQLHFWQVVSRSVHSVEHSAPCSVSWKLWAKPYLRFVKGCMHFYAVLLLTSIFSSTTKI